MGQKIHPVGFRLGVNNTWSSLWFANSKNDYTKNLHSDLKARKYIDKALSRAGIGDVFIKRSLSNCLIEIYVARPGMVIGKNGKNLEILKAELEKILGDNIRIEVKEIKAPQLDASVVAQNIVEGITRRINTKFLVTKEMQKTQEAGALGCKIWISGLINGSAIHRTEKKGFGVVPLHTLRADISYSGKHALTYNHGVMGVKVWIYRGEKNDYII